MVEQCGWKMKSLQKSSQKCNFAQVSTRELQLLYGGHYCNWSLGNLGSIETRQPFIHSFTDQEISKSPYHVPRTVLEA